MKNEVRLLVVDDDEFIREGLTELLSRNGYAIDTADSGEQALGKLADSKFDLVITDIKMPGISGLELLSEIRKHNPSMAVILVTAFATVETAIEAMRMGASDFVTKPFKIDDFLRIIRTNSPCPDDPPETEELMHNETRDRIFECISINPGIHYRGLQNRLLLGNGVLNYHLRLMSGKGLIRSKRERIYRRYYPTVSGKGMTEERLYTPNQQRIVDLIKDIPGILQRDVSSRLGLSRQLTSYHVNKLCRMGVLKSKKDGNSSRFWIK